MLKKNPLTMLSLTYDLKGALCRYKYFLPSCIILYYKYSLPCMILTTISIYDNNLQKKGITVTVKVFSTSISERTFKMFQ